MPGQEENIKETKQRTELTKLQIEAEKIQNEINKARNQGKEAGTLEKELIAAEELGRKAYGFEIKKQFHRDATDLS